ncbi:RsmF rRNA methyltransferase first C-terminal domain-containing protein [Lentilactobacillus otakiensis]|uniref:RNA methylase n=1 Tax=Lentilactobacillus otakiensis DSM 19908 = JCM 15040 TaxID=1423780 RepID=S4NF08_9LACO|nr:RsmF rRNA methyltransferase first C-terminal domain-containing protein [Lentilactobacillus otakiensis]KRL09176.1 RNA methylase [Lentilactobacillus otakiensis DSM 19908 = JCM 15040]MBZ3775793.1 RsmF rRNA methyltransferase first C-terminal domain-containing protein [Lentilactobacillus otakiensis]MDV3519012.1 RsmF rRNA methyltransferase first C-terminal domain-containing protein [Lentilactobacillus otakiensis]GAD15822.1 RNA methylase [Lentilactobacillus otakiensis DSM 19908 = JCM 15040]
MHLPSDFIHKYQQLMGEVEADKFIASFDQPTTPGFRINPLKAHRPADLDLSEPTEHCQFGYHGQVSGKTVDHQSGAVYSQEPSAMYVGEVAHPNLNEKVLDLCAAPGGKTTHLGSYLKNTGLLIANEIDSKRSKALVENVERFGMTNTIVTNTDPDHLAAQLPEFFDRILVDAPCSGEGMFRKDPDAIQYWSLDYPVECASRQRTILTQAVKNLKPGGELIYSTCTFAPEEDEQIIAWLVDTYGFEIQPIKKFAGMDDGKPEWANGNADLTKCVRIFPHHFNGEGHFIAKLKKPVNIDNVKEPRRFRGISKNIEMPTKDQNQLFDQFAKETLNHVHFQKLVVFKDHLYSVPEETPNLSRVKIVRLGLEIGTFKKNRFEPSYGLALALHPDQAVQKITIDQAEWQKYVHGDTFQVSSDLKKGWYLLVCENQPVGFAKVVNGTAKNFFPKGLRFAV